MKIMYVIGIVMSFFVLGFAANYNSFVQNIDDILSIPGQLKTA